MISCENVGSFWGGRGVKGDDVLVYCGRREMALLETCFCCSLAIAAGFIAVYLLVSDVGKFRK